MFPSRGPHIGDYAQTTLADPPKSRIDALGGPLLFLFGGCESRGLPFGSFETTGLVWSGFLAHKKCFAIRRCATFLDSQLLRFALICFALLCFALL